MKETIILIAGLMLMLVLWKIGYNEGLNDNGYEKLRCEDL